MRRNVVVGVPLLAVAIVGMMAVVAAGTGPLADMRLRVSTHSGAVPLVLDLTGSYTSAQPSEITGCLITVDRTYTSPSGNDLLSKEEMPCVEPVAGARAPDPAAGFKRKVTLKEPGIYSYRIVLVGQDGKRVASTSQEVKVYRSRFEAGVSVSGTTPQR